MLAALLLPSQGSTHLRMSKMYTKRPEVPTTRWFWAEDRAYTCRQEEEGEEAHLQRILLTPISLDHHGLAALHLDRTDDAWAAKAASANPPFQVGQWL